MGGFAIVIAQNRRIGVAPRMRNLLVANLVGSVPGKTQTDNSGSDKRELYTIAQDLQKPYHDLLYEVHNIIIRFNHWDGCTVNVPFVQLTTLNEHRNLKEVTMSE